MHAPRIPTTKAEFEEGLNRFVAIIEDEDQRKELLATTGDEAQKWLDVLQQFAEYPDTETTLRSTIFKIMIRLSRKAGLHPRCLTIENVEMLGTHPVGGGAFGDVWKGKIGDKIVGVKVLRVFTTSEVEQVLKDYMREAIVWRQLNHQNLLPFMGIYYLDSNLTRLCLISPWMERGNLVQFMKSFPELVDRHRLVHDVARGLCHLHEMKIIHGDLKGVNILVTPDLGACIGDFGLARVSDTQRSLSSQTSHSKGTTRWLSPELLRPGPNCVTSRASDVYAYGCVCYEIYTGRIPFYEMTDGAVMFAVVIDGQHPTRPGSPSALVDVVWAMMVSCWNAEPSARPNMADVLARVREFRSDGSPGPADEKKLLPIPSHQAKRYKGTQANLAVSPDRTLTMVAVKPPKSEGAPSRPPVPRDLRSTPSPEPQATLGMPTPGGPSDNPYYVLPPSSYISELPSRYAAGSEPRSSRKRDYSPDNYSPSPPPSKMSKILSLQRPRSVPPADSEEEYEELVGELEPDPRYATPGPDDAPEEIQERISDVVDRLMQLDEQWTTFFAWKNQHHVPGQLKVYEFIKKMADRYVGHRVPFRSVRHHRFEMRHILRALLLNKDPKIGDNCHETLHLLSLYGPEGTRLQDPRIVKEMDNKEQPKNGAKPIKRFLRLLREIDGEWKKARNNSA